MSVTVYIALGSNLGDRAEMLRTAIRKLQETKGIDVLQQSAVYETDPVGYTDQPAFLNMVIKAKTTLSPEALLQVMQQVEDGMGRVRTIRWGPRVIDLDLILYGMEKREEPHLQIPHPEYLNRVFVLVPLLDVWGELPLPFEQKTIRERLQEIKDTQGVKVWGMLD